VSRGGGEVGGRKQRDPRPQAEKNYRQFSFPAGSFIVLLVILVRTEYKVLGGEEDNNDGTFVFKQATQAYGVRKYSNSFLTLKLE